MATTVPPHSRPGYTAPTDGCNMSATPCTQCTTRLLELKRQAMKIMMIEYHRSAMLNTSTPLVGTLFLAVYEQLKLPDSYRNGIDRDQCENCATHVEILKREAVLSLHSVSIAPFLPKHLVAAPKAMTTDQTSSQPQIKHYLHVANEKHDNADARKSMSSSVKSCSLNSTDGAHHREKTQSKRQVSQNEIQQHDQAAAIFFAKAAQKFNIPAKKKTRKSYQKSQYDLAEENEDDIQLFPTNFSRCVSRSPPSNPPGLFKYMGRRVDGKVSFILNSLTFIRKILRFMLISLV